MDPRLHGLLLIPLILIFVQMAKYMKMMPNNPHQCEGHRIHSIGQSAVSYFLANVPRQVSLAGGVGGSQKMGVKALGLLCCQQALCLNA